MPEDVQTPEGGTDVPVIAPDDTAKALCSPEQRAFWRAYDDGNGLWISSPETPFYQGFFGCICPQE